MKSILPSILLILLAAGSIGAGCNGTSKASSTGPSSTAVRPAPLTTGEAKTAKETTAPQEVPMDDINPPPDKVPALGETLELSEEAWRNRLTTTQYRILRRQGTEAPGSGVYNKHYEPGTYHCSGCNNPLFSSDSKFDSKTGWPSYYEPIEEGRVGERIDRSMGMQRVEIVCEHCGGHLGHVFNDGPEPTGLRYCVNSVSLYFRPEQSESPTE